MKFSNYRGFQFAFACFAVSVGLSLTHTIAQDTSAVKKWHYLTEVYLMFPSMSGQIGVAELPTVDVDADAGDILGHLKLGAMLYFEAYTDRWAISTDLLYMKLGQDLTPGTAINSGNVVMKQLALEVAGLYRTLPFLEAGIGGRLVGLETDLDFLRNTAGGGTEQIIQNASKTWFDPIVIIRGTADINDKWLFQLRGDIGGFGIGSDLTWQVQAYAGYRFSRLFQTTIGYRILAIDYDKGSGPDRFVYDINTFGPVVRLGFNF